MPSPWASPALLERNRKGSLGQLDRQQIARRDGDATGVNPVEERPAYDVQRLRGNQGLDHEARVESNRIGSRNSSSSIANTPRLAGRRAPAKVMAYRRPYMSGVTRTFTRRPSVARFRAARFSSGVLYLAGRLSSASLSGLSGSGLPFVCVFAMDSMLLTIVPADPDVTGL
jgi:hypothetical protein